MKRSAPDRVASIVDWFRSVIFAKFGSKIWSVNDLLERTGVRAPAHSAAGKRVVVMKASSVMQLNHGRAQSMCVPQIAVRYSTESREKDRLARDALADKLIVEPS